MATEKDAEPSCGTELGDAIRRVRMGAGLSQVEVAAILGINSTYVSHLEAGRREPSLELLRRFAALDCPPSLVARLAYAALDIPPPATLLNQRP